MGFFVYKVKVVFMIALLILVFELMFGLDTFFVPLVGLHMQRCGTDVMYRLRTSTMSWSLGSSLACSGSSSSST